MPHARIRLGQLLVDAKLLRQSDLDEVLALQRSDGRRLGTLLLERGLVNETQLTQVLSHQLSIPLVSLMHIEFSRQLLNLVPHVVAERYCMVPIYVRHVRSQGQTLYVAMDDPSNDEGLRECEKHAGLPVKAMIAQRSDIRNAIRVYYGTKSNPSIPPAPEARPSRTSTPTSSNDAPAIEVLPSVHVTSLSAPSIELEMVSATPSEMPESTSRMTIPELDLVLPDALDVNAPPTISGATIHDLPPETLPDAGASQRFKEAATSNVRVPVVSASDVPTLAERHRQLEAIADSPVATQQEAPPSSPVAEIPQPKGPSPKMIALTLLDGTTITLPAAKKSRTGADAVPSSKPNPDADEPPPSTLNEHTPSGLTARDLVAALRAICHGADAKEILGPTERMEAIVAALLSVMLRKGIVADWEFVDELRKM